MTRQPVPLHLDFHLLDRQIVDRDGALVGKVDDLEVTVDADGVPTVTALLVGQRALGDRIGGRLGRILAGATRAAKPPLRISYDRVERIGSEVTLNVKRELLADPPLEAWLSTHVIEHIPGASRESK